MKCKFIKAQIESQKNERNVLCICSTIKENQCLKKENKKKLKKYTEKHYFWVGKWKGKKEKTFH